MGAIFPEVSDWDGYLEGYLPAPAALGDGLGYNLALSLPWSVLYDSVHALAMGLLDVGNAYGYILTLAASRLNQPRGGLSDQELRSIVRGARAAAASDTTHRALLTVAYRLGTEDAGRVYAPTPGIAGVFVQVRVDWLPSESWQQRAGAVVRSAVRLASEVDATAYTVGAFRFGSGPGFGVGTISATLPAS